MLQLKNETPFPATLAIFSDPQGVDTLYIAVRATFSTLRAVVTVAEQQQPIRNADEYRGESARSSLYRAGEIHPLKPSTDVVLLGNACAPGGRRAAQIDVSVSVGPVRKVVRVFGDREWRGSLADAISAPAPFARMPLAYELAFGGVLEIDDSGAPTVVDLRNPVGVGFARQGKQGAVASRRLPNLEDPMKLIARPSDAPPPAGFGFIAPAWEPRRSRAGTYDDAWRQRRAPYLPIDFDPRFFNAAHPDLVCSTHLRGGEPVEVSNASPSGLLRFRLPRCELSAAVRIGRRTERPAFRLETVLLEPGEHLVSLLWRAAVACDKRALRIDRVELAVQTLDLGAKVA